MAPAPMVKGIKGLDLDLQFVLQFSEDRANKLTDALNSALCVDALMLSYRSLFNVRFHANPMPQGLDGIG